jgi:hypothetical protein
MSQAPPASIDWPVWWFVRLEKAVEDGDHDAAARAQRELERLGVVVRYGRPKPPRQQDGRGPANA